MKDTIPIKVWLTAATIAALIGVPSWLLGAHNGLDTENTLLGIGRMGSLIMASALVILAVSAGVYALLSRLIGED